MAGRPRSIVATTSTATAESHTEDIVLRIHATDEANPARHVTFTSDTVDNEFLSRRSSKEENNSEVDSDTHVDSCNQDPSSFPNAYERPSRMQTIYPPAK